MSSTLFLVTAIMIIPIGRMIDGQMAAEQFIGADNSRASPGQAAYKPFQSSGAGEAFIGYDGLVLG